MLYEVITLTLAQQAGRTLEIAAQRQQAISQLQSRWQGQRGRRLTPAAAQQLGPGNPLLRQGVIHPVESYNFV